MADFHTPTPSSHPAATDEEIFDGIDEEVDTLGVRAARWLNSVAGTGDVITAVSDVTLAAYGKLNRLLLVPVAENTGAVTINVDGLGARAITDMSAAALTAGFLRIGTLYELVDDGTRLRCRPIDAAGFSGMRAPDLIVRDQKTAGSNGGTYAAAVAITRALNTVVRNALPGASLASNLFTLPAGVFLCRWRAPMLGTGKHQSWLRNETDAVAVASGEGGSAYSRNITDAPSTNTLPAVSWSEGLVVFTITAAKEFSIQHQAASVLQDSDGANVDYALGLASGFAANEVYTQVEVWKVDDVATSAQGQPGGAITIPFTFDDSVTDADPGPGNLRLNAGDDEAQNLATVVFADIQDANLVDVTAVLDSLDDSTSSAKGYARLVKSNDETKWLLFRLDSIDTAVGYRKLNVVLVDSSADSPFLAGDEVLLMFTPKGDKGDAPSSTPATSGTITTDVNDFDAGGTSDRRTVLLVTDGTDHTMTGLVPKISGEAIDLFNTGTTGVLTLKANSVSSAAANRFNFNTDFYLPPRRGIRLWSNTDSTGWIPIQTLMNLGEPIITETTIAVGATVDLGSSLTLKVLVNGSSTTPVTSFGTRANALKFVRCNGTITLAHNAVSLILPGNANIATSDGDTFVAESDASGNWRVRGYQRSNGRPVIDPVAATVMDAVSEAAFMTRAQLWDWPAETSGAIKTLDPTDNHTLQIFTAGVAITLPKMADLPRDWSVLLRNTHGADSCTITPDAADTLTGSATLVAGAGCLLKRTGTTAIMRVL